MINQIAANAWRAELWRYAERMSGGAWVAYPFHKYLAERVQTALEKGGARLVISCPPRHGKSELLSHWLPTWFLDTNPNKRVMLASYADTLAGDFGVKVRTELATNDLAWAKPDGDTKQRTDWKTREGGGMRTAGVGGGITGRGGDLLIIDDPVKNWEEAQSPVFRKRAIDWFNSTLYTRAEPGASIIVIMTRWHQGDLAGFLLDKHTDDWEEIRLPAFAEEGDPMGRKPGEALCPERYTQTDLQKIKNGVGSIMWAGMFQQRPTQAGGELFKAEHLITKLPTGIKEITQGVDLAISTKATADYTVVATVGKGEGGLWILDVQRVRASFRDGLKFIRAQAEKHNPKIIGVEKVQFQAAVVQELMRGSLPIVAIRPDADKTTRALPMAARFEEGVLFLAPGLPDWFLDELLVFPNGEHDDGVDAAVYALRMIGKKKSVRAIPFRSAVNASRWTQ